MSDGSRAARRPPAARRRGAVLEDAILRAAGDELREGGYARFTIDRVAARAATNKNVVYRRWPNKAALAVAAYRHGRPPLPLPDTGSLRGDALALLREVNRDGPAAAGAILADLLAAPDAVSELRRTFGDGDAARWLTVLGRGVARGEVAPEALRPRVATTAMALLRHEYLTRGLGTLPDEVVVEIVDAVYLPLVRAYAG